MTTRLLLLLALLLAPALAAAQTVCTPTYVWGNTPWSRDVTPDSPGYVPGNSNTHHVFTYDFIPAGQVFRPRSISVSTLYGGEAQYMVELLANVPPYVGSHYHEVARGWATGTPALHVPPGDAAAMLMQAGERLAARAGGGNADTMAIMLLWSGWLFPEACLQRLLAVEAPPSASAGGGTTAPDLTALASAATSAAAELTRLATEAQNVP
jgi:hypothetical protein